MCDGQTNPSPASMAVGADQVAPPFVDRVNITCDGPSSLVQITYKLSRKGLDGLLSATIHSLSSKFSAPPLTSMGLPTVVPVVALICWTNAEMSTRFAGTLLSLPHSR